MAPSHQLAATTSAMATATRPVSLIRFADPRVIRFADPRPIRFGDPTRIPYAGPSHEQSWRDQPSSHEPRFGIRPQVACGNKWARIEALQRNARFLADYIDARHLWLAGPPCLFPAGTYWLRRFARVPVAGVPKIPIATA